VASIAIGAQRGVAIVVGDWKAAILIRRRDVDGQVGTQKSISSEKVYSHHLYVARDAKKIVI
jgi:hypothetical protein